MNQTDGRAWFEWSVLLSEPSWWIALGLVIGVLLGLLLVRVAADRAKAGRPWCARCGHRIASVTAARCAECGAPLVHERATRWDHRAPPRRRAAGTASLALVVAVTAAGGGLLARALAERHARSVRSQPGVWVDGFVRRVVERDQSGAAVSALWSISRGGNSDSAIVDEFLRQMPETGPGLRPQSEIALLGAMLSQLMSNERTDASDPPSPRLVALAERLIGEPTIRLRRRHASGSSVHIRAPQALLANDLRVVRRVDRITVDGETPQGTHQGETFSETPQWVAFAVSGQPRSATLRIEWTAELQGTMPARSQISLGRQSSPAIVVRRLVHEQTIEIVPPGEPTVMPTREPAFRPWGSSQFPWRLELRSVGRHQLVHLLGSVRHRHDVVLCGQWFVDQGDRRIPIGAVHSTATDGRVDHVALDVSSILDEPLDPAGPLTLRFEPRPDALRPDAQYDLVWDEPLTIELDSRSPSRSVGADGRVTWTGIEPK